MEYVVPLTMTSEQVLTMSEILQRIPMAFVKIRQSTFRSILVERTKTRYFIGI